MSFIVYNKIDEGSFGQIYLIRKNGGIDDQKTYAMKTIKKDSEISTVEQRRICRNELEIFKLVHGNPFFVQLKYAFKTRNNFHFVMEYITGGNLFDFLNGQQLTLHEAKVCAAEMVSAIAYLHAHRIVYRDLKLENILISNDGHLLLTDFGLAREIRNNKKPDDQAGTFNYFAPEMISGSKEHSYEVDWWTLGITLSELLIGHSPFLQAANEKISETEMCKRILNKEPDLTKLRSINGGANITPIKRFIQAVLIKDPAQRLGTGQNGYNAIKLDEFFRPLNWIAVKLKKYKCLNLNISGRNGTQRVSIDFSDQCEMVLPEKTQKYFQYVAPELQPKNHDDDDDNVNNDINGSTVVDIQVLSTRIEMPSSIASIDIVLSNDLFIKFQNIERAIKTLKQLIVSQTTQKSVRFSPAAPTILSTPKSSIMANSQRKGLQFKPYKVDIRRSNHIADRRNSISS